jgi:hypothetical protein
VAQKHRRVLETIRRTFGLRKRPNPDPGSGKDFFSEKS